MRQIIWIIIAILIIGWLLGGFAFNVGGSLIHILIVLAVILILYNLFYRGEPL